MTGIAVVGAGHWGPHLVRNFHDNPDSAALWVVDTDERRRESIGARFRDVATTGDVERVLADDRVDAIVVATPTSTHADLVKRSLASGKHVLVEKPLTDSLETARQLARRADEAGLILMVGHVFLFNPAVQAARRAVEEKELGPIRYVSMTRTNLGPVRRDVNAAWDLAAHDISIANFLLDGGPAYASAVGGSWLNPGIHDAVFATLRYPHDVLVHIEASWLNPRKRRFVTVIGDTKMLTIDDMDLSEPLRIYDKGVDDPTGGGVTDTFAGFRAQIREGVVTIPKVTLGEPLRAECESFLRRIRGETDSVSNGWAGVEVVRALEAIQRSLESGGSSVALEDVE